MVAIPVRPTLSKLSPEKKAQETHWRNVTENVQEQFQSYDVVWAKMQGYPWWPGVIFFDWEDVDNAVIDLQPRLTIPPPVVEKTKGGQMVKYYHALVMFLDRFNCITVKVTPAFVCSYALNYQRITKSVLTKNSKYASSFRVALARAEQILHMGNHMTTEELALVTPPPAEKRQKTEQTAQWEEYVEAETHEEEDQYVEKAPSKRRPSHQLKLVDDDEDSDEPDDDDDGDFELAPAKSVPVKAKPQKKATTKKGKGSSVGKATAGDYTTSSKPKRVTKFVNYEAIESSDEYEDEVEILQQKPRSRPVKAAAKEVDMSRKKASRKEGRDIIEIFDDDDMVDATFVIAKAEAKPTKTPKSSSKKLQAASKQGEKNHPATKSAGQKAPPKRKKKDVESSSEPSREHSEDSVLETKDGIAPAQSQAVTLTPLAQIWTTREEVADGDAQESERKAGLAYKLDVLWDNTVFSSNEEGKLAGSEITDKSADDNAGGRDRPLGKRQGRSVQQSQIRQGLMNGNLDPHTMVQCEAYLSAGIKQENSRSRSAPLLEAPFQVHVHPDATFVCDLHAHLATCEIIGFLGGKWDEDTKTLYIQAAFPCRSLVIDGDDGSTDVEMDPGSEIELREIIQNAELEVVGWYHSHPAFAPDPSIRDIENQASYQQLFQRRKQVSEGSDKWEVSEPFVGLIVGTYDTRRDTPVSLFRYFHVRSERVSSSLRREVFMPYELVPTRRYYQAVLEDEERDKTRHLTFYPSVFQALYRSATELATKIPVVPSDVIKSDPSVKSEPSVTKKLNVARKRKVSADIGAEKDQATKKARGKAKNARSRKPGRSGSEVEMIDVSGNDEDVLTPAVIEISSEASQNQSQGMDVDHQGVGSSQSQELSAVDVVNPLEATPSQGVESITDQKESTAYSQHMDTSAQVRAIKPSTSEVIDLKSPVKVEESPRNVGSTRLDIDEIVCDTSQSQPSQDSPEGEKLPSLVTVDEAPENTVSNSSDSRKVKLEKVGDEVVPASPRSERASQNQSQDDPSVTTVVEDDPFAGIEIIDDAPSPQSRAEDAFESRSLPSESDQANNVPTPTADNADPPVKGELLGGERRLEMQRVQETIDERNIQSPLDLSPRRRARRNSETGRKQGVPEVSSLETAQAEATAVPESPDIIEVETEANSTTSAGSTPIHGGNGRRRTRKPTLTTKKINSTPPRAQIKSPRTGATGIPGAEEHVFNTQNDAIDASADSELVAESQHASAWDDVEVIDEDFNMPSTGRNVVVVIEDEAMSDGVIEIEAIEEDEDTLMTEPRAEVLQVIVYQSDPEKEPATKEEGPSSSDANAQFGREIHMKREMPSSIDYSLGVEKVVKVVTDELIASVEGALKKELSSGAGVTIVSPIHGIKADPRTHGDEVRDVKAELINSTAIKTEKQSNELSSSGKTSLLSRKRLFGQNGEVEHFRSTLEQLEKWLPRKQANSSKSEEITTSVKSEVKTEESTPSAEPSPPSQAPSKSLALLLAEKQEKHLHSLRHNYDNGIYGCTEQVITLVDYYRDFDRRTDLTENWKPRISKLQKIEASLREYVRYVNLPVASRENFIQDIIGYLSASWAVSLLSQR
ncbi:hypothetical protein Poli38472_013546 [Pythium oligandrum]|uniref:MPN domain-containing protein n=1 Tax=Pythium oligandrum TaxID=41045 RepID=A0A8K1C7N6_PYTOL|nr:hypothetical protein Poli38472_013546 [Pythium oligandrum]|eukprot:TMW58072.1 hypothetical protein Poli38472_013546 [Pythium oligandrum]